MCARLSLAKNLLSLSLWSKQMYMNNSKTKIAYPFFTHIDFSGISKHHTIEQDTGPRSPRSNKHWSTPFWKHFNKHILSDSLVIHRTCIFIILNSQITSERHGVRWMILHCFVFIVLVCIWFFRFDTKVMVGRSDISFEVIVPRVILQ